MKVIKTGYVGGKLWIDVDLTKEKDAHITRKACGLGISRFEVLKDFMSLGLAAKKSSSDVVRQAQAPDH